MIKRRSKLHRGVLVMASVGPSVADFLRGLWTSRSRSRFLVPLVVFLCVTGIVLVLAGSVEALAPFIYSIF
jgi:hypothetical protein